jgi:hypothetical protein
MPFFSSVLFSVLTPTPALPSLFSLSSFDHL